MEESTSMNDSIDAEQPSPSTSGECKVCAHPSHGIHFGVLSCRACAAFFRRTVVLTKKYNCRRANLKCIIDKTERYLCRLCRYNKCIQLGMTSDNVQWNRDTISSISGDRKRKSEDEDDNESTDNEESFSPMTPAKRIDDKPALYDFSLVLEKINKIFDEFQLPNDPVYKAKNTLGRMDWALRLHRKHQKKHDIRIATSIKLDQLVHLCGDEMVRVAEWMMHSAQFRQLDTDDKFSIFTLVWQVWQRFERLTMSLEVFGKKALDEKLIMTSSTHAIRMDNFDMDLSKVTDYSTKDLRKMFHPYSDRMFENVARPLLQMKPSSIEITYMLCQIFWHVAGKTLQGKTLEAGEKFIEEIANDLHEYYMKEYRMSNYAARLIKLMTVVNALQKIHMDRQKILELAKLFDVFKVKLTEPNLFH